MILTEEMITIAQQLINECGRTLVTEDGKLGPNTINATEQFDIPVEWINKRKIIGTIQYGANEKGFVAGPIDGFWGPQTEFAYEQLVNGKVDSWRNEEDGVVNGGWPMQNQKELIKYFGDPGENQGKVTSPYPLKIAWDTTSLISKFTCHEKIVQPVGLVLDRVLDYYGNDISDLGLDMWGGCFNKRKMRGGDKWSTHAWGIAIDWDPVRNKLHWKSNQANFAKPEYKMWWKLWEDEGFVSLGRTKNYDFMHVQAANVNSNAT